MSDASSHDPTTESESSSHGESRKKRQRKGRKKVTKEPKRTTASQVKGFQETIANQVASSPQQIELDFEVPSNKSSLMFWNNLCTQDLPAWLSQGHKWPSIYNALRSASDDRRDGKTPMKNGTNRTRAWQPIDLKGAKERLENPAKSHRGRAIAALSHRSQQRRTASPSIEEDGDEGGDPGVHVIFCGIGNLPDTQHAIDQGVRSLLVYPSDPFQSALLKSLEAEDFEELERVLGHGLCSNQGQKEARKNNKKKKKGDYQEAHNPDGEAVAVHGVLLAALWARHTGRMSFEFHDWTWLDTMLRNGTLSSYLQGKAVDTPVILFTLMRRPHFSEDNSTDDIDLTPLYSQATKSSVMAENEISCYPSCKEASAESSRFFDVRCLDKIAKDKGTPPQFSYRPKMCPGKPGPCKMEHYVGRVIVRKCSTAVDPGLTQVGNLDDAAIKSLLKCSAGSAGSDFGDEDIYMHQEFPSTTDYLEILAVMIGNQVTETLITRGEYFGDNTYRARVDGANCFMHWTTDDGEIKVKETEAEAKAQELYEFCEWTRAELLKRWPDEYKSFEVAAVFRIGISEVSPDARFWVIDIPRWTNADLMPSFLSPDPPYDKLCKVLGMKFAAKCGNFKRREESEPGQEDNE